MPSILDHSEYELSLCVENPETGELIDIAPSCENITWQTTRLASQPGTLKVTLKKTITSEKVTIPPGSRIRFGINNKDYFYGLIEEIELSKNGEGRIVYVLSAVDHLKLLQGVESAYREIGMTASTFFMYLMTRFGDRGLNGAVLEGSSTPLDDYYFATTTLYEMIKRSMALAHIAESPNSQYILRDNLGTIEWRELKSLKTDYVIGDESFATSYTYGVSIAEQTYNVIKVIRPNAEIGMMDTWTLYDSENIRHWWQRQLVLEADDYATDAEIKKKLELHLEAFNRPRRKMQITAIGINGLQAGDGLRAIAGRASIDHELWCEEVTHVYTMDSHEMTLVLYL